MEYNEARELVRRKFQQRWDVGTFCLDDREIVENDDFWVFNVGAREWIVEGDLNYAIAGSATVVFKADGRIGSVPSVDIAFDDTLQTRENPNPTFQIDNGRF